MGHVDRTSSEITLNRQKQKERKNTKTPEPCADLKGGFPSGFGLFGQPCGGLLLVNAKVCSERGSAATAGGAKLSNFGHECGEKGLFRFCHKSI